MDADWALILDSIVVSFVLVPAALSYVFLGRGPPAPDTTAFAVVSAVAMRPGFLLGGTALWVAARG